MLVGLFPVTVELAHALGALLNIGFGNVVLILVGTRATGYYAAPHRVPPGSWRGSGNWAAPR